MWQQAFSRSGGDQGALRGSGGTPSPLGLAAGPLTLRLPAPGSAPEIPSRLLLPLGPPSRSPASTSEGIRIGVRLPSSHASQTGAGVRVPRRVLGSRSPFRSSGHGCLLEKRRPLRMNLFPCWGWRHLGHSSPQPASHGTQTLWSIQRVCGHIHLIPVTGQNLSLPESRETLR